MDHGAAVDLLRLRPGHAADDGLALGGIERQVHPIVERWACLLGEIVEERREGAPALDQQVEGIEAGHDGVALGDMPREAEAAALLAAHDRVRLHHPGPHVFEAHRRLVYWYTIPP